MSPCFKMLRRLQVSKVLPLPLVQAARSKENRNFKIISVNGYLKYSLEASDTVYRYVDLCIHMKNPHSSKAFF